MKIDKKTKRIGLITVALCALGFSVYFFLSKDIHVLNNNKNHEFIAARPSYGPLVQTKSLSVSFENNKGYGVLPIDQSSAINLGQDVILYDRNNFVLPLGGKVSNIKQADNQKNITIDLPEATDINLLSPHVQIITLETTASKRLPKSAIMKDDQNKTYILRVIPNTKKEQSYRLSKTYINIGLEDEVFFEEAGFQIKSDDLVIINPDKSIQDGIYYIIEPQELDAYMHNPTKQAWIDFELDKLKQQQTRLIEKAENCGKVAGQQYSNSGNQSDPSNSASCGASNYKGADPFLVFQNLIQELQNQESDMP